MFLTLTGGASTVWSIVKLCLMLVLVLALAYFTSRIIARYQNNTLTGKGNIQIVESFRILGDKYIAIVKIGESYYAIGVGKTEINMLDKLDPEQLKLDRFEEDKLKAGSFREVLNNFSKKNTNENKDSEK